MAYDDLPDAPCVVSWPSAPLTNSLVIRSLKALRTPVTISSSPPLHTSSSLLVQWSSYDSIDHELTHLHRKTVLASSYTFRKALIRKHFLSRCLYSYLTKRPDALLRSAVPKTFELELSFADELDEMWTDELWELGQALEASKSWWILKPGMSDRGMGIRLFNSKESLQDIFLEFDYGDSDYDGDSGDPHYTETSVVTSQLRHFVIQEYIHDPLLVDPLNAKISNTATPGEPLGRKFHLRAYCVASGALQVYLYERVLALFSASPYEEPVMKRTEEGGFLPLNLQPHLTNTSLQDNASQGVVRLLDELVGCRVMSPANKPTFTTEDATSITHQIMFILGETFKAALENPVHFQPLPNAFELYGVDFVVAHVRAPASAPYQVKLLEVNAEPAIEMTGARLTWILEDLFMSIGTVCVAPFLNGQKQVEEDWAVGETHHHFMKCLDEEVRND